MEVGKFNRYLLFHHAKNHAAQDRAPYCSNPANHRHQQDGNAGLESKHVAGINERSATRVDAAGTTSEPSGNRVNPELGGIGIYADVGRRVLILLDGA